MLIVFIVVNDLERELHKEKKRRLEAEDACRRWERAKERRERKFKEEKEIEHRQQ